MTRLYLLLAYLAVALTSCTLERDLPPPSAGPLDSTIRAQTGLSTGKIKFKGPVTFQIGGAGNTASASTVTKARAPVATGTGQAQDFTKAGQQGGAVATAPGATAGATTRTGVPTWQLVAGGFVLLLLLLAGLAYKFRARFLPLHG